MLCSYRDFCQRHGVQVNRFAHIPGASARRRECIIYPALLAFILLAAYGFYRVYTLTSDVRRLAHGMETVMISMNRISRDLATVSENLDEISANISAITTDIGGDIRDAGHLPVGTGGLSPVGVRSVPVYQTGNDTRRMNHTLHETAGPVQRDNGVFPF